MTRAISDTTRAIRCPAKLNLTLAVGSPRPDGLHPIASVMAALDFADDLHLRKTDTGPSTFTRVFATDAPKPQPIDWPIESDLLFRAHAMLEKVAGRPLPVACTLEKRIPSGAGLGGGSSNAAGMLVGLRSLFALPIADEQLLSIAQALGADVVFLVRALLGHWSAIVTGIGEVIEPIDSLPPFHVVLVFPDGSCPTAAVYQGFDRGLNGSSRTIPSELIATWRKPGVLPDARNDLTDAALLACPSITRAIQAFTSLDYAPRLTGSGSCVFAFLETKQQAVAIADSIRQTGLAACAASHIVLP